MTCSSRSIAVFVTSHGFGHAARASAVMASLIKKAPFIRFEVFTQTPVWFFEESFGASFGYHRVKTDIGLVQKSALCFDLDETIAELDRFIPFDPEVVEQLAGRLVDLGCEMVLCDISALGIAAARLAGIPSILMENFTWDWIYEEFFLEKPEFRRFSQLFRSFYDLTDFRIQTRPVCRFVNGSFRTAPVSRSPLSNREETRKRLGIRKEEKMVLVTMGGIPGTGFYRDGWTREMEEIRFVIPGSSEERTDHGNMICLPYNSGIFHPDLVHACDAVIGKLGYSTLSEVYHADVPFGWIPREDFRESRVFETFIGQSMRGVRIPASELLDGTWTNAVDTLLSLPKGKRAEENGAVSASEFILSLFAR